MRELWEAEILNLNNSHRFFAGAFPAGATVCNMYVAINRGTKSCLQFSLNDLIAALHLFCCCASVLFGTIATIPSPQRSCRPMQVTITLIATGFGSREGDDAALASYMDRRSGAGQAKAPVVERPDIPPRNIPQSPPPPTGGGVQIPDFLRRRRPWGR